MERLSRQIEIDGSTISPTFLGGLEEKESRKEKRDNMSFLETRREQESKLTMTLIKFQRGGWALKTRVLVHV